MNIITFNQKGDAWTIRQLYFSSNR